MIKRSRLYAYAWLAVGVNVLAHLIFGYDIFDILNLWVGDSVARTFLAMIPFAMCWWIPGVIIIFDFIPTMIKLDDYHREELIFEVISHIIRWLTLGKVNIK